MSDTISRKKKALSGIPHFAFCLLTLAFAGCSTHRENDWKDVFTGTVGEGYGVSVRLGPIRTGLYSGRDDSGLRAGVTGSSQGHIANYDYYWLFHGMEHFDGWMDARQPLTRHKATAAQYFFPCFVIPEANNPYAKSMVFNDQLMNKVTDGSRNGAFWTQCDIAIGLGGGIRLGFNPGELLDALLGHVGIDLYGDDTTYDEEKAKREEENLAVGTPVLKGPGVIPINPPKSGK